METSGNTQQEINSDEKLMAMFSHLSIFMGGIFLPIVFWAVSKDKSKFVRFHSLQTLFFHISFIVLIIIFSGGFVLILMALGLFSAASSEQEFSGAFIVFLIIFYIVLFGIIIAIYGYSIYMAIKSYKGEFSKYPIIGNIIYKKVYGE